MVNNLLLTDLQTGLIGFFLGLAIVFFGIIVLILSILAIGKLLKTKEGLTGKEFISRYNKKLTIILAVIVLIVAIVCAVLEGTVGTNSRSTFWMFAGVMCLGEGLAFYLYSLTTGSKSFLFYPSIIITALGMLWLVTDIIINGTFGSAGSGWWVGLISAVCIAAILFLISRICKNSCSTVTTKSEKESKPAEVVVAQPTEDVIPEHIRVAIVAAIYAYYEQQNEKCEFIVRKIKRRS